MYREDGKQILRPKKKTMHRSPDCFLSEWNAIK